MGIWNRLFGKQYSAQDLIDAVSEGDLPNVKTILSKGAGINCADDDGFTPLLVACENDNAEIARLLIETGANVDIPSKQGITPLWVASRNGNIEIIKQLIKAKAEVNKSRTNDNVTPLYIASQLGHTEIVKLLLDAGADVHAAMSPNGCTPLWVASGQDHLEVVRLLLEANADVDATDLNYKSTPLWIASENNYVEIVRLLLEANANVNIADKYGVTPLWQASRNGHFDTVRILLEANADVNIFDRLPLPVTVPHDHPDIFSILTKAGAKFRIDKDDPQAKRLTADVSCPSNFEPGEEFGILFNIEALQEYPSYGNKAWEIICATIHPKDLQPQCYFFLGDIEIPIGNRPYSFCIGIGVDLLLSNDTRPIEVFAKKLWTVEDACLAPRPQRFIRDKNLMGSHGLMKCLSLIENRISIPDSIFNELLAIAEEKGWLGQASVQTEQLFDSLNASKRPETLPASSSGPNTFPIRNSFILEIDFSGDESSVPASLKSMIERFNHKYEQRICGKHSISLMEENQCLGVWAFDAQCKTISEVQTILAFAEECARRSGFKAGGKCA